MPNPDRAILDPFQALSIPEALMVAVCGLVVVFMMLAILALVIIVISKIVGAIEAGRAAAAKEAPKAAAQQLGVSAYGIYIVEVIDGSPADQAGLEPGDRVISIDNTEIAAQEDLGTIVQSHAAGDTISITVARGGQMVTLNVTLGEQSGANS